MMLETNNTEQLPENAFIACFNHGAILNNLEKIIKNFTLSDIAHLEEALGTSRLTYIDTLYTLLNKRYFLNVIKAPEDSAKKHFQKTVTNILNTLREKVYTRLSAYAFFEAAQGRVLPSHSKDEMFWLQQIQNSYHLKENISTDSTSYFLSNIRIATLLREPTFSKKLLEENAGQVLYCAAYFRDYDTAYKLLKNTTPNLISAKDKGKALQYAALSNSSEIVDLLLKDTTGKPISAKDKGQALQYAVQNKCDKKIIQDTYNRNIICPLLRDTTGEPISAKDKGQALQYAAQNKFGIEIIRALLSDTIGKPISAEDKGQALQYAAQKKYDRMSIYALLDDTIGEPISSEDKNKALWLAIQARHIHVPPTCLLLKPPAGKLISLKNKKEILNHLLRIEDTALAEALLDYLPPNIISATERGETLVHAAQNEHALPVEILDHPREPMPVQDENFAPEDTLQSEHDVLAEILHTSLLEKKRPLEEAESSSRNKFRRI